jgi:hypothetical protein
MEGVTLQVGSVCRRWFFAEVGSIDFGGALSAEFVYKP